MRFFTTNQSHGHANDFICHLCGSDTDTTYWHIGNNLGCTACKDKVELLGAAEGTRWIKEVLLAQVVAEALNPAELDADYGPETVWPDSDPFIEQERYEDIPEPSPRAK